jgi:hypothetical protein
LQFNLEVSKQDVSDEKVDSLARELINELRDLDIESLKLSIMKCQNML